MAAPDRATERTLFAAVPGVYRQMLKYGAADARSHLALRHGLMAGETPPPGLFEEWQARTGTPLYEALGMSEISTYISARGPPCRASRARSASRSRGDASRSCPRRRRRRSAAGRLGRRASRCIAPIPV